MARGRLSFDGLPRFGGGDIETSGRSSTISYGLECHRRERFDAIGCSSRIRARDRFAPRSSGAEGCALRPRLPRAAAPDVDDALRWPPLGRIVVHGATNTHQEALCACGSGLRSCRCCELDPTFAASSEAGKRVDILADRAAKALASGDAVAAEARSLEVLNIAPRFPGALWILYQIRRRAGHEQAALALLQRLVAVAPNNVDATQELAMLLFQRGDLAGCRTSRAKCGASRTDTSAIAQFDGHDPD